MLSAVFENCLSVPINKNLKQKPLLHDDGSYRPSEYGNTGAYYEFGYNVNAAETGDVKQHTETRLNDQVRGTYFVVEPNGYSRSVQYLANRDGFNAVVRQKYQPVQKLLNSDKMVVYQASSRPRQELHTNILNRQPDRSESIRLSTQQKVAFEKLLKQAQLVQNNPVALLASNKNEKKFLWHYLQAPSDQVNELDGTSFRLAKQLGEFDDAHQYAVDEPVENDFDIRRSVNKAISNASNTKQ